MSITDTDRRTAYIAGLRQLAELLETHPDIPTPYTGGAGTPLSIFCDDKEQIAALARAFPGRMDKRVDESSPTYGFELHGSLAGLKIVAYVHRYEVCTRVVTGTREVTTSVPDPSVVVPMVEVTETVEDVEWKCEPLLAGASA